MALPKKFGRVLGVALAGMLAFLLLVFFVSIFFAARGTSYSTTSVGRVGGRMMSGAPQAVAPGMMANPLSFDTVDVYRGVAEKSVGNMMESVSAPTMMTDTKVIKNGSLSLRVQGVDEALAQVGKIAGEFGGNISDSRFDQAITGVKSGTVTVRVPVDKFSETFSRLKGVASVVLSESTSGTDVTAQPIDLQARINNEKAAEATLQTLFEKAVKMSDVIEVTDKLAQVRSEIESLEGQMRYLSAQTDRATITLFLTEDVTVTADQGFRPLQTLKESLMALVQMLGSLVQGLIRFMIVGLPVLLVYGGVTWLLYRFARRLVMRFWPGMEGVKHRVIRKK